MALNVSYGPTTQQIITFIYYISSPIIYSTFVKLFFVKTIISLRHLNGNVEE